MKTSNFKTVSARQALEKWIDYFVEKSSLPYAKSEKDFAELERCDRFPKHRSWNRNANRRDFEIERDSVKSRTNYLKPNNDVLMVSNSICLPNSYPELTLSKCFPLLIVFNFCSIS